MSWNFSKVLWRTGQRNGVMTSENRVSAWCGATLTADTVLLIY